MDFVEYVYTATDGGNEELARMLADGLQTFITPIGWTFPEWFDTAAQSVVDSASAAAEAVGEFLGISGSE
jgi:hypothetical protein